MCACVNCALLIDSNLAFAIIRMNDGNGGFADSRPNVHSHVPSVHLYSDTHYR